MKRNAKLDAESVTVDSSNGTIALRGTVSAAPGATRVKDHILVAY
jgi:osmotically-inducible protein OsmY